MIIDNNNEYQITILYPQSIDYKIRKIGTDEIYNVVYLGKFASPNEYEDISVMVLECGTDIKQLNEICDQQDAIIIELYTQIAIMQLTL